MSSMKNLSKTLCFAFLLIFSSLLVSADNSYTRLGTSSEDYNLGSGIFNSDFSDSEYGQYVEGAINSVFVPYVADLNNDGINDIIIIDDDKVKIYNQVGSALILMGQNTLNLTGYSAITNPEIFDINSDGMLDIVYVRYSGTPTTGTTAANPYMLTWNGSNFFPQEVCDLGSYAAVLNTTSNSVAFGCDQINKQCMFIANGLDFNNIKFYAFKYGTCGGYMQELLLGGAGLTCLPVIGSIPSSDIDSDGKIEYATSVFQRQVGAGSEYVRLVSIEINDTSQMNTSVDFDISEATSNFDAEYTGGCADYGRTITQAHLQDLDGGSTKEVIFGRQTDENNYKVKAYDGEGNEFQTFPFLFNGEGHILSNIIQMECHPDAPFNGRSFALLGYDTPDSALDLLCGSPGAVGIDTKTYEYTNIPYNISLGNYYELSASLIHRVSTDNQLEDGVNLDELISTYGIFRLDQDLADELELIWSNPKDEGAINFIDVQKTGSSDVLLLTEGNLWYLDDGIDRVGCGGLANCIESIITRPCITQVIQINETVEIQVTARDELNNDNLSVRLIAYEGMSNEQDSNWTSFLISGSTHSLSFEANKTGNNIPVTIYVKDSFDETINDSITYNLPAVSNVGLTYDDGVSCELDGTIDINLTESISSNFSLSDTDRQALRESIRNVAGVTDPLDSSKDPLIVWVILLFVIFTTLGILIKYKITDPRTLLYLSLVIVGITWIFLISIQMIPAWTLIVSIVLAGAFVGYKIWNHQPINIGGGG